MNEKSLKSGRNSAVELLRIAAMLLIIISHFSVYGIDENISLFTMRPCFNKYFLETFQFGFLGVDIFMLISGYFGIKSQFKAEKLIKLLLQVFFYSAVIYVILCCSGIIDFSVKDAIKACFPAIFKKYWFFSGYVLTYVLSPFINRFLNSADRKIHLSLIAVLWLIWGIIPLATGSDFYGTHFTDLMIMYIIGAYLRLYPDNIFSKNKLRRILLPLSVILFPVSVALMNYAAMYVSAFENHYGFFYAVLSPLTVTAACLIFISFTKLHIKENKFINAVASCVFGVYLIHDNQLLREYLWGSIIRASDYAYSKALVLYVLLFSVIIFSTGAVIDFIRQKTIEKPVMAAVNAVCSNVRQKAVVLIDKKSKINR